MTVNDGIPFSELDHFTLDRPTMQRLRQRFCEQWQVVVLGEWSDDPGKPVTVGMPDPRDERLVDHLVHLLARPVEAVRLNHYELDKALDFAFERRPLHEGADGVPVPMRGPEPAATASTADLLNHLVRTAVRVDASDIHIEHYVDDVDVRLRVDGVLRQLFTHITPANVAQVVGRIKVLARLDITERRLPQDGRIRVLLIDGDHRVPVDLRVSTAPGPTGEDVVMRVVEQTAGVMPLSGLGLPPRMLDRLVDLLENPEGMVIVTGPTGSGKTSTLYAGLDEIRGNHRKIVTADPCVPASRPRRHAHRRDSRRRDRPGGFAGSHHGPPRAVDPAHLRRRGCRAPPRGSRPVLGGCGGLPARRRGAAPGAPPVPPLQASGSSR